MILGIPLFGRTFTLQYLNETEPGALIKGPGREGFYTQTPGLLAYYEICEVILNEGGFKREDEVGSPYVVMGDQWIGYDDPESIRKKVKMDRIFVNFESYLLKSFSDSVRKRIKFRRHRSICC